MANFDLPVEGATNWGPRVTGSLTYLYDTQQLKYTKPASGIPLSDLSDTVKTILNDSASTTYVQSQIDQITPIEVMSTGGDPSLYPEGTVVLVEGGIQYASGSATTEGDIPQVIRTDTAVNWAAANPVLLPGEVVSESNTGTLRVGNGTSPYNDLPVVTVTNPTTGALPDKVVQSIASSAVIKTGAALEAKTYSESAANLSFLGLKYAPISPSAHGARGDGTGDDYRAVQDAINEAGSSYRGGEVMLKNHRLYSRLRLSQFNVTLTGGTLQGGGMQIGRNVSSDDMNTRIQNVTLDMLDPANGDGFILDRVSRATFDHVIVMNAASGFLVPTRNEHQHVRRILLTATVVADCDYGWFSGQPADNLTRYNVGDVQLANTQWYNNRTVFRAEGIDGLLVTNFKSFQRQRADRARGFDLGYINFASFSNVNLFEPGEEALKLSRFQNFHWTGGNVAWAGQKAMRSAILLQDGDLGGNAFSDSSFNDITIVKPTRHGIEVGTGVDRIEIGHGVRIEQAGSSEFYSGTDDLSSITHYGVITPSSAIQTSVFAVATANSHALNHTGRGEALNGEGKIQRSRPKTLTLTTQTTINSRLGYERVLAAHSSPTTISLISEGENNDEITIFGVIGNTTIAHGGSGGATVRLKGSTSATIPTNGTLTLWYANGGWNEKTRSW
jgi:hypothetical protein